MKTRTQTNQKKIKTPQDEEPNIFRDPTPQEVDSALASILGCFFDSNSRDYELLDHWEEHCVRYVWNHYRMTSSASANQLVRFG
jgi:hypothetical protein